MLYKGLRFWSQHFALWVTQWHQYVATFHPCTGLVPRTTPCTITNCQCVLRLPQLCTRYWYAGLTSSSRKFSLSDHDVHMLSAETRTESLTLFLWSYTFVRYLFGACAPIHDLYNCAHLWRSVINLLRSYHLIKQTAAWTLWKAE